jgi:hypothetical protein
LLCESIIRKSLNRPNKKTVNGGFRTANGSLPIFEMTGGALRQIVRLALMPKFMPGDFSLLNYGRR